MQNVNEKIHEEEEGLLEECDEEPFFNMQFCNLVACIIFA